MATKKADPSITSMGARIEELMTARGFTQLKLESAIGASRGYLSRIISGERGQKISPEYLRGLATALETTENYIRYGKEVPASAIMTPTAGLSPRLDEIDGYREAEFVVARENPEVPFEIFESARMCRMQPVPSEITKVYLEGLVKFLASSRSGIDMTEKVRSTLPPKKGSSSAALTKFVTQG